MSESMAFAVFSIPFMSALLVLYHTVTKCFAVFHYFPNRPDSNQIVKQKQYPNQQLLIQS